MIKNIIFDWSGVIRNDIPRRLYIVNFILQKYHFKGISKEELRKEWEKPPILFYKKYIIKFPHPSKEEIRNEYNKIVKLSKKLIPPKPVGGIVRLLKKLKKRGFNLIVITGDYKKDIMDDIDFFKFDYLFSNIFYEMQNISADLEKTIRENNLNFEESLIIADNEEEIRVGKSLGLKTIGITWGMQDKKRLKLAKPDFIADNLIELESIIFCFLNQ